MGSLYMGAVWCVCKMISILDTYIMNVYWFPHGCLAKNIAPYSQQLNPDQPFLVFFLASLFYWPQTIVNFLVNLFAKEGDFEVSLFIPSEREPAEGVEGWASTSSVPFNPYRPRAYRLPYRVV